MRIFNSISLALLLSMFTHSLSAQNLMSNQLSSNLHDGPYVFYHTGKLIVKAIKNSNVEISEDPGVISVQFPEHSDWNFSVKLKAKLENEPTVYPLTNEIFVLSDIEGEFEALRALLLANHVIDKHYN